MRRKSVVPYYLVYGVYLVIGIVLAVEIYSVVFKTLLLREFCLCYLIDLQTIKLVVSCLIGVLFVGIVFLLLMLRGDKWSMNYRKTSKLLIKKSIRFLMFRNIIAFSVGGVVGLVVKNLFNIQEQVNIMSTLFSSNNMYEYLAMVFAASFFSVFFTLGTVRSRQHLESHNYVSD